MKYFLIGLFVYGMSLRASVADYANIARMAYHEHPKTGLYRLLKHENDNLGNRLLILKDDSRKTIYVSVRGTVKLENWISNSHIMASDVLINGLVSLLIPQDYQSHYRLFKENGKEWFSNAFKDLQRAVWPVLKTYSDYEYVFVGHSYGGLMANLLAQDAYHQFPEIKIFCHVFSAPGSKEIRENTLKIPELPEYVLKNRFYNHVRWTDPVGKVNTQEGNVLRYQAASREGLLTEHAMNYFAEDLGSGIKPFE